MNKEEAVKLAKDRGASELEPFSATAKGDNSPAYLFTQQELLAFANACEKIGMEKAAKICEEQGREWDSDNVIADKNYAAHCADAIRAHKE